MYKQELYARRDAYLARRAETDSQLSDIRDRYARLYMQWEEVTLERDEAIGKLDEIRDLADGLGTVPTLAKLRAFLQSIKDLLTGNRD